MAIKFSLIALVLLWNACVAHSLAQRPQDFLGVKLRPEVQIIVKEIEKKTGKEIYAEFVRQEDFQLGSSFISEEGTAVVLVDFSLEDETEKLEAVIVHELLHLRLRVNNYPTFLFSPNIKTAKGRAIDVEQSNVNDLKNIIEHHIFKAEMERFGLYAFINLAGDTAEQAKKQKGQDDGQDDVINYVRAILEYQNPQDIATVEKIYAANGWRRSLQTGKEIADIISFEKLETPKDVETVFLKCLLKLYPPPNSTLSFKFNVDASNKFFRRMIINIARNSPKNKIVSGKKRR